jgi:hypothetical protein
VQLSAPGMTHPLVMHVHSYLPGQPLKVTSPDPRLVLDHAEGFRQEVEAARPLCYQYNLELLRSVKE